MVGRRSASAARADRTARAPERADARGVRERVLAAATRRFATQGFDGTSLQEIADDVGVAKPSVLHHFPSKDALRDGVLDNMQAHFGQILPGILLAATAPEGRFDSLVGALVEFFVDDPDRARLLVREALDRPAEMKKLLATTVRPWMLAIAEYIRKGQRHGEHFPDVDPEAYLLHVVNLVVGGIAIERSFRPLVPAASGDEARQKYVRELVRIAKASLFSGGR